MTDHAHRPLRADALRNAEKLASAAREVFAELGINAPLEEVARRAGVGIATLYRRFPTKDDLVRAALEHATAEDIAPQIRHALRAPDPRQGITIIVEAVMELWTREINLLLAAGYAGVFTTDLYSRLYDPLVLLVRRAQEAGTLRADLVAEDVPRIVAMLVGVIWTVEPGGDGWRRYVTLVLDGLAPATASTLPSLEPLPDLIKWPSNET